MGDLGRRRHARPGQVGSSQARRFTNQRSPSTAGPPDAHPARRDRAHSDDLGLEGLQELDHEEKIVSRSRLLYVTARTFNLGAISCLLGWSRRTSISETHGSPVLIAPSAEKTKPAVLA